MKQRTVVKHVLLLAVIALVLLFGWGWLAATGYFGALQPDIAIAQQARPAEELAKRSQEIEAAAAQLSAAPPAGSSQRQILFGDLHVHSTFSMDANTLSLPMSLGEGAHPPADACDFSRYCSALDFWSINDHAEGLTSVQWSRTRELVRECNAVSGDGDDPDMVTFLGWEWTQIGDTPQTHYGHKNVVLRDIEEGQVPMRPISSRETLFPGGGNPLGPLMRLLYIVTNPNSDSRQPYHDFARFLQDRDDLQPCDSGVPVRELPADCQEGAPTPAELYAKLDDWGYPYLVIPHGNSWGFYTPPLSSWDKQLAAHSDPQRHEPLIEVFSGHGNIEQYKPWRAIGMDDQGRAYCPEPGEDFLPECWQAGEIIRKRCLDAGESVTECEDRARQTRANFILTKDSGHWTVPGSEVEDWLDAGQCRDCYMPAYNHRPTSSVQYGLAIRDFSNPQAPPKRFRWGILGSSDIHSARPGSGYKEILRRSMSDTRMAHLGPPPEFTRREPRPSHLTMEEVGGALGPYFERFSSFLGTGGLVAVHSTGRNRHAIFKALEDKQVYGTSGDRILLWFELLGEEEQAIPMGSSVTRRDTPRFEVRAMGDWEQKPGCPERPGGLSAQRLQRLCVGECYHPGDTRRSIERIEVVRIRPQVRPGEPVGELIEDPWKVMACESGQQGCRVQFTDADFSAAARDTVYYVRAIQSPTPTVNGAQLRCTYDEQRQCISVNPCRGRSAGDLEDDCLAPTSERAWSSPIFVDYGEEAIGQ